MGIEPNAHGAPSENDVNVAAPVHMLNVVEAMALLGVVLMPANEQGTMAHAVLNDVSFSFGLLPATLFVRGDRAVGVRTFGASPAFFLAANEVTNSAVVGSVCVMDLEEDLRVRAEVEITIAAGLTPLQLKSALKASVDQVFGLLDRFELSHKQIAQHSF
ncbi:MAG: hypothetical protein Q4A31_00305 [Corynebacterium sp.]|uniref:hypothetical protein n=1 Tax=Corynebacterium sp. TaxID=1720 RepID=UPI0026DAD26F|nr:hypothetical protein [Corynebacterium sp.]MDO4760349.1 hypothetical protein [Corynebacterium sp.]